MFALLIALVPLFLLLRNALREKPRNYVVIAGTSVLIFALSVMFLGEAFPSAYPLLGLMVLMALFTFVFAVASWSQKVASWKIVAALVLLELLLMYLMFVYGGPAPGGSLGPFLIFGTLWFFNGLVIVGLLGGLMIRSRRRKM